MVLRLFSEEDILSLFFFFFFFPNLTGFGGPEQHSSFFGSSRTFAR